MAKQEREGEEKEEKEEETPPPPPPQNKKPKEKQKEKQKMIGTLSLETHPQTRHHASANLGIMIAPEFQGRGYGTEAINWALDWGFGMANLHSVRLTCFSFNDGAARLYERLGFVKEGVRRESLFLGGEWWDHLCFSMLVGEWLVLRGGK